MSRMAGLLWGAAVLATPAAVGACPVCAPSPEESRTAFLLTALFMTALPFVLVGSLAAWIWRRSAQGSESVAAEAGTAGSPAAGPRTAPDAAAAR